MTQNHRDYQQKEKGAWSWQRYNETRPMDTSEYKEQWNIPKLLAVG